MCGAKEILLKKNVRDKGNPNEILKKPHNLSPILAPAPGTPGNPGKNLTICGPSPGPPEILEKNLTILRICLLLVVVVPTSCAEAPCGGSYDIRDKALGFTRDALEVRKLPIHSRKFIHINAKLHISAEL